MSVEPAGVVTADDLGDGETVTAASAPRAEGVVARGSHPRMAPHRVTPEVHLVGDVRVCRPSATDAEGLQSQAAMTFVILKDSKY